MRLTDRWEEGRWRKELITKDKFLVSCLSAVIEQGGGRKDGRTWRKREEKRKAISTTYYRGISPMEF